MLISVRAALRLGGYGSWKVTKNWLANNKHDQWFKLLRKRIKRINKKRLRKWMEKHDPSAVGSGE